MKKAKIAVTNYQVSIWPLCMLSEALNYHFHKIIGRNYPGGRYGIWRNQVNQWALDEQKSDTVPGLVWKKAESNPGWIRKMAKLIPIKGKRLTAYTRKIYKTDLTRISGRQLYSLYEGYRKKYIDSYLYFWIPNALEGQNSLLTKKLEQFLLHELRLLKKEGMAGQYLSILTTPRKESLRQKERREFLHLVSDIQKDTALKALFTQPVGQILADDRFAKSGIKRLFARHYDKYCFLPFDYEGPAWTMEYFLDCARGMTAEKTDAAKQLVQLKLERQNLLKVQKGYEKELGLSGRHPYRFYFGLAREMMYLKDLRKDKLYESYFHMDKLIREIGRRLRLSPVQVRHILPQEMKQALIGKKYSTHELNERIKLSVLDYTLRGIKIHTGKKALSIIKEKIYPENPGKNPRGISGEVAFPGKAKGVVRLVFKADDMRKMERGNILVSVATNPNLIPAMKKAAAIITDKGGITSHAAIISRELKIPCITGTKLATKALKDGDLVEVDANNGTVKKL